MNIKKGIYLLSLIPQIGFASFIIDNNTSDYITFYVTSTARCPGNDEYYVPPHTIHYEFSELQMLDYCRLNNPCYFYLYGTANLNYAKICNGDFVGIMQWNSQNETIQDLYVASSKYSVVKTNSNTLLWNKLDTSSDNTHI